MATRYGTFAQPRGGFGPIGERVDGGRIPAHSYPLVPRYAGSSVVQRAVQSMHEAIAAQVPVEGEGAMEAGVPAPRLPETVVDQAIQATAAESAA